MVLTGYSGVAARVPRDYLSGTPMVLPGDCTHARGRSSRGALAHSRGYSAGYYCRGALGGILYCGALDGLFSALQGVLGGTQGVLPGDSGHSRGVLKETLKELRAVLKVTLRGLKGYTHAHTHTSTRTRAHSFCVYFPTFSLFLYKAIHVSTPTHMPKRARTHPHLQHCVCVCVRVRPFATGAVRALLRYCGDRRYL